MKKIADAADPLYKTLDDGQKRRLAILTHMEGRFGGELAPTAASGTALWIAMAATAALTGIAVTTGTAGRAGTAVTEAAPSGSSGARLPIDREHRKNRWDSGGFLHFPRLGRWPGNTPAGLLDIGGRFAKMTRSCEGFPGPVPGA